MRGEGKASEPLCRAAVAIVDRATGKVRCRRHDGAVELLDVDVWEARENARIIAELEALGAVGIRKVI